MRTLKDLAHEALTVQDACNLSGVVHAFSAALSELRKILPSAGTAEINGHPIAILYSSKIASLTNSDSGEVFSRAYNYVKYLYERKS